MKKVLLCTAALMVGTVAFAQLGQLGPDAATKVTPLAGSAAGANSGESIQNGNGNKVQVRQAGTSQSVFTDQNDGSGLGNNLARVMQTGDVSDPSGIENDAEVLQSGTANQSTTIQQGDFNNAHIAQGRNGNDASADNKASIQQGNAQNAERNFAAIQQDGERNQATSFQTYDNSQSFIDQDGNDNEGRIRQIASPNGSDGHSGLIAQDGDDNGAQIRQDGNGATNLAEATQDGDGNNSKQLQTNSASSGGAVNTALVNQGTGSFSSSDDVGNTQGVIAGLSTNGQNLGPSVTSTNGIAFQTQTGTGDFAQIKQYGDDAPNYGEQIQAGGSGNTAVIAQDSDDTFGTDANYAKQVQLGSNNLAGVNQAESGNKADQRQSGSDNTALASQNGDHNLLNMKQFGAQNVAFSEQDGTSGATLLTQYDGQSYVARQNATIGGANNQIDVLQQGPTGDGVQVDCTFDVPMDPMSIPDVPGFSLEDICPGC